MTAILWDLFLVGLSATASWFFSRMYYRKSLENQATEAARETKALIDAVKKGNERQDAVVIQQYIETAVEEWRKKGTAVPYVDSLNVPREQKAQILRSASLRHKGREPKRNPYLG